MILRNAKFEVHTLKYLSTQRTGKSLSEVLLFAEHGENMLCKKIVLNVRNNFWVELGIFMY